MSISLTQEQLTVVSHPPDRHGRVLAGPGTGKSSAAIALAERLLKEGNHSLRVKFLTFTRAATQELAKKLPPDVRVGFNRPSTFHSFSTSTLLKNPGSASFSQPLRIPDNFEFKELIRPHLSKVIGMKVRKLDLLVAEMAAKWESLNPSEHPKVTHEERARFLGAWLQHRRVFGYTLLQELPDLFRIALRNHNDLVGIDFDFLIVDEYQDLNACELEILRLLAQRGCCILAIGDDDQSIYLFRKAHPIGLRRFLDEFATDLDYKLTICHRSPRSVIEWAQHVIQGDPDRLDRGAPTCQEDAPLGMVALLGFPSDRTEAKGVAQLVEWLIREKNVPPSEILILSRTDRSGTFTKPVKDELQKLRIPISDPTIVETILANPGNRRLIAVLRLLVNRSDSLAWWTLLHIQPRVGGGAVEALYQKAKHNGLSFGGQLFAEAERGFGDIPSASRNSVREVRSQASAIFEALPLPAPNEEHLWGKWITEQIENHFLPSCSEDLKDLLIQVDAVVEAGQELNHYLSQIQPLGKDITTAKAQGVRFMTMTGSKGLTVRATIVLGAENDLIPRPGEDLAEERRLLYVAMTRPQEYLFLTWAALRRGPGARAGRANTGRRQESDFLRGGPVESQDGVAYVKA